MDIVLDYDVFDVCMAILTHLVEFLQKTKDATTSSATYKIHTAVGNALENLPCEVVKEELLSILSKHGWTQQFPIILETTLLIAADIDMLADRLLAA
jgi:hypothetical protein